VGASGVPLDGSTGRLLLLLRVPVRVTEARDEFIFDSFRKLISNLVNWLLRSTLLSCILVSGFVM